MEIDQVRRILGAPWIPHPEPQEWTEVGGPVAADTKTGLKRMLIIVEGLDGYYVLAQDQNDKVTESWKVLL